MNRSAINYASQTVRPSLAEDDTVEVDGAFTSAALTSTRSAAKPRTRSTYSALMLQRSNGPLPNPAAKPSAVPEFRQHLRGTPAAAVRDKGMRQGTDDTHETPEVIEIESDSDSGPREGVRGAEDAALPAAKTRCAGQPKPRVRPATHPSLRC